ncbi:MAG: HNH endonuclease [Planctomycetota bacterium]
MDKIAVGKRVPKAFLERLNAVKGKRSRAVVDHILKHGHVTTEDLKDTYGYDHPPRAVRDVREQGIPIETYKTVGKHGRQIAAYRFADPASIRGARHAGRRVLSKKLKDELTARHGSRCAICLCDYEHRYLQIDHRVPYEVAGDEEGEPDPAQFMLICGSCNRAKSWSCEHCRN